MKEVLDEFISVKEFQIIQPKCEIKDFKEIPKNK